MRAEARERDGLDAFKKHTLLPGGFSGGGGLSSSLTSSSSSVAESWPGKRH